MRICMHISFLEGFCQKYRFLPSLTGLGGMRGDVTGMEEPPEDLQDILANVGDLKISSGPLHCFIQRSAHFTLLVKSGVGGGWGEVMDLVYSSSSSSFMGCSVFFSDE